MKTLETQLLGSQVYNYVRGFFIFILIDVLILKYTYSLIGKIKDFYSFVPSSNLGGCTKRWIRVDEVDKGR